MTVRHSLTRALLVLAFAPLLLLPIACRSSSQSAPAAPADPMAGLPVFDADAAFSSLSAQCAFGPRVPNKPPHDKCRDYIVTNLKPYADVVSTQDFPYRDTNRNVVLHLSNIIGVINPSAKTKVMICAHWDTRPTADNDFDIGNRDKPIPGADDGASGVAVLLELAKVFHDKKPRVCVELVFLDGEDWGPDDGHMYLGADYFAAHPGAFRPDKAVLIDMIGQKDLSIPVEQYSESHAPDLVSEVRAAAIKSGYGATFPPDTRWDIIDDQVPLNKSGIPTIDLIDFDYAYWHTLQDTPDKCSPQSLNIVGQTLETWVYDQGA